jgi:hypothetical protein
MYEVGRGKRTNRGSLEMRAVWLLRGGVSTGWIGKRTVGEMMVELGRIWEKYLAQK